MKFLTAIFVLIFGTTLFATPTATLRPRIVKVNASGFIPPEFRQREVCEVYSDRVIITRSWGEKLQQKETRRVQISNLQETILAAVNEKMATKDNPMCDAPQTTTSAEVLGSSLQTILLFQTGGCGSQRQEREGPASFALRSLVDSYCPVTYDPTEER